MNQNDSKKQRNSKKRATRKISACNNARSDKRDTTSGRSNEVRQSTSNPYTWYANFPNFSKDVATLAFGHPVGQPLYINGTDPITAAGICCLWYVPGVGVSEDNSSPINRQATRFQTYLRSIQRSAASYDAADSMLYMVAIDSLYAYWAYLRRAYGVAQLFTPTNKYYPKRLLQAMGIDPNVADDLATFRAFINKFALNIGRYALPAKFDIAERHMWMNTGLYVDGTSTRAQTYLFCPAVLWKYNNTVSTGSQLDPVVIKSSTLRDLNSLIAVAKEMLNAIENDDDTMNISGDVYRAYGPSNLMRVEETTEGYSILPVYDQTVLSQIENCTILTGADYANWHINQDPSVNSGAITFTPTFTTYTTPLESDTKAYGPNVAIINSTPCLNMHMDSPSAEAVMEATRLTCVSEDVTYTFTHRNDYTSKVAACGTEIVVEMDLSVLNQDNIQAMNFLEIKTQCIYIEKTSHIVAGNAHVEAMAILHQFDWAPMMYIVEYVKDDAAQKINVRQVDVDMDNFTTVSRNQLSDIHEAAILSLLDIGLPSAQ